MRVVVSSPFFRCVQTACEICLALGGPEEDVILLLDRELGEVYGPSMMGAEEPKTPGGFRNVRDMRALQLFVDHPSCYGIVYLTPEELKARKNWAAYEALREKYYADDAFVPLLEKVRYVVQDGKKELGPIFMWRAKDKGEFGRAIAFLGALLAIAVAVVYWAVTALASVLWA